MRVAADARGRRRQCDSGHMFCVSCVRRYVEETVFGNNSNVHRLPCMDTKACEAQFRFAEVRCHPASDAAHFPPSLPPPSSVVFASATT
jgi:hypothetical protein